ncbi:unnamed protein product [Prorocentrum cordatum]|uniref:C3H1-type domain-containing protein n=1 Tax=Prorocentrum cordatum TaxID=2364126 RepID=A0ABN9Y912_9DINO|nr:unnamed protein product [Polarella glacialis]
MKDGDLQKLEVSPNQPRASALKDWLQRVALRVGGWHRLMGSFFQRVQVVAYQAYEEYLKLQPMDRPTIQPRLILHDDARYLDIEFKLRAVLLESVPETGRREALATRATSTVEVLFATLVWAGPGTLKDKTDVLEAVERRGKGPVDVNHVHSCLQRWQFDLVRLQRLQMQPPDPIVQLATLRTMVGRMIEQSHALEFRLNSFETQHGLSGASTATQRQVDGYWRYLSAESREISDTPPRSLSRPLLVIQAQASASPKGKGKDKSGKSKAKDDKGKGGKQGAQAAAAAAGPELCRHFESNRGCRNGGQCPRKHRKLEPNEIKCFNCGSKEHPKAQCTAPRPLAASGGQQQQPPRAAAAAVLEQRSEQPLSAHCIEQAVARAMQSFAAQADSGYRADWGGQAASRRGRVRVGMLLCDSGASHELQHLWPSQAPPPGSVPIQLGLAVGRVAGEVYMSEDQVVYAVSSTLLQALFPISAYVRELELNMSWSPSRAAIFLPGSRTIELVVDSDGSVFISKAQAEVLRGMQRMRRGQIGAAQFVETVRAAVVQQSLEQHRAAGHPHFRPDCAECRFASGRRRPHWRLDASTRPGGQMSANISGPHPYARWPSALQEDGPRRARFFLLCAYSVFSVAEQEAAAKNERFAQELSKGEDGAADPASTLSERFPERSPGGCRGLAGAAAQRAGAGAMAFEAALGGVDGEIVDEPAELLVDLPGDAAEGRRTWYYARPLQSKAADEVGKALELVVAEVSLEFQTRCVFRLHAHCARELSGPRVRERMAGHGVLVTNTPGWEPNNNGRAERGIGAIKQRARAMLIALEPADREQLWPAAVQHAAALQRREAQGRPTSCPAFGSMVAAKIQQPVVFAFAPRAADRVFLGIADYVSQSALAGYKQVKLGIAKWVFETSHNFIPHPPVPRHALTGPSGGAAAAASGEPAGPAGAQEEPAAGPDSRDIDGLRIDSADGAITRPACHGAHEAHRRDETCRRAPVQVAPAPAGDQRRRHRGKQPPKDVPREASGGIGLSAAALQEFADFEPTEHGARDHQEELPSTLAVAAATCAADSVADDNGMADASLPEFREILKDSGMQPVTGQELRRAAGAEKDEWFQAMAAELSSYESNAVFDELPAADRSGVRASEVLPMKAKQPDEVVYTQNVEISSVRLALAGRIVVRPPKLFVDFGLVGSDVLWVANKGIYGLRIAPRAWGAKRDNDMRAMQFLVDGAPAKLVRSRCDPSVWMVVAVAEPKLESDRLLLGLLLVYVDDFLCLGPDGALDELESPLKATWTCSVQSRLGWEAPGKVTYLGLEIEARGSELIVHQSPYLNDMLAKWGLSDANGTHAIALEPVPLPRTPEDGDADPAAVRAAQRMAGGLLWLATRSRPDVSFATSRLSSFACSHPDWALRLGKRILRYLIGTRGFALVIGWGPDDTSAGFAEMTCLGLDVFADASFEAETAQTGVAVFCGGALIDWRSQKQPQVARSTAEAGITALKMGVTMLEGAEATMASIAVGTRGSTWVGMGTLLLKKVASEDQRADGLTKVFAAAAMGRIRDHFGLQMATELLSRAAAAADASRLQASAWQGRD